MHIIYFWGSVMEKNLNKNGEQINNNNSLYELDEYRVYEHPLLPNKIVKKGYSWPALIIGPVYLIYRQLWVPAFIWFVSIVVVRILSIYGVPECDNCPIKQNDMNTIDQISALATFFGLGTLWFFTNDLWEKDLINRGYIMTKSLRARSMDDARAIIEREKEPTS